MRIASAKVHNFGVFDWNDLKYFLAVARSGSTLAAAKILRLSQSTVHRRLEELEKQLGQRLVLRHPTGYRLTELGEDMLGDAERVEQAVADFERRIAARAKEPRGTVKLTCPEALGPRLMHAGFIDRFCARYPDLRVEFVMSDKVLDLAKGQADVAVRAMPPSDTSLVGRKIADSPWAIYASCGYVERNGHIETPADINHHAVILFDGALRDHHSVQWIQSVAPNARIAARAGSLPTLLLAAKSGAGLTPMPVIVGESESELVRVLGPIEDIATPFYLLMHQDMRRTPRVRAFFDFFVEELPVIRPLLTGKTANSNGSEPRTKPRRRTTKPKRGNRFSNRAPRK